MSIPANDDSTRQKVAGISTSVKQTAMSRQAPFSVRRKWVLRARNGTVLTVCACLSLVLRRAGQPSKAIQGTGFSDVTEPFCQRSKQFQYRHHHSTHTDIVVYPDKFLNEMFFKNKTQGFYIEIGVLCPLSCSTGSFFDLELCWEGLCVDGSKESHEATLSSPRTCSSQHGIICGSKSATDEFLQIRGGGEGYSGIRGFLTPDHLALIEAKEASGEWTVEKHMLNCIDIQHLLRKMQRSSVDLVLLDVEGAELEVMKTFDFSELSVDVFSIETDNEMELSAVMRSHGYDKVATVGYDVVYRRRGFS